MESQEVAHIPNHTIDPATGFLESKAYAYAFDAPQKLAFLQRFEANCLALYDTCAELGISHHTINKHRQIDSQFNDQYQEVRRRYLDKLQAVGRKNALNPKSVIERIWVQKSNADVPGFERYADQKTSGGVNVQINLDPKLVEAIKKRETVIDAEIVDNQQSESAKKETINQIGAIGQAVSDQSTSQST
jgi:hypothetical protein